MDSVHQTNFEPILVPRARGMSAIWLFVSVGIVGFGLMPWIIWFTKGKNFNWGGASILALWSAFPMCLAAMMIFHSLCRIQIDVDGDEICRRKRLGPISICKRFVTDHIQLNSHIVWGRHRNREHQVLYMYEEQKQRQVFLWDLECRDLQQVGKAIAQAGTIRYSEK